MSQNAENNDVAHKDAQSSGWKKYVPQRVNSLSRRSLLLTAGCIVAADVVAMMPQFARAGILGDEAAATVSRRKQLENGSAIFERILTEPISRSKNLRFRVGTRTITPRMILNLLGVSR